MNLRHAAFSCAALMVIVVTPGALAAQTSGAPVLPGSPITNEGVIRAGAQIDSVFISRLARIDTVDPGDFTAHVLARLGVPAFDSTTLGFRVTTDTARARISGRIADFPADVRHELGPLFTFIDSTAVFVAELSMPQHSDGIMRFRLERVKVGALTIPDLLLSVPLAEYARRYPVLTGGGREFLVEIPPDARARFVTNGIEISVPPARKR